MTNETKETEMWYPQSDPCDECGVGLGGYLGRWGCYVWYRCRACAITWGRRIEDLE